MSTPNLRKRTVWNAHYKGVAVEIQSWGREEHGIGACFPSGNWNAYIYLSDRNCPRLDEIWLEDRLVKWSETSPERLQYDHFRNGHISAMPFRGGCTFYEKKITVPGHRVVKIGCDYQHSWDEGMHYDENQILGHIMQVVDHLEECGLINWKEIKK